MVIPEQNFLPENRLFTKAQLIHSIASLVPDENHCTVYVSWKSRFLIYAGMGHAVYFSSHGSSFAWLFENE